MIRWPDDNSGQGVGNYNQTVNRQQPTNQNMNDDDDDLYA